MGIATLCCVTTVTGISIEHLSGRRGVIYAMSHAYYSHFVYLARLAMVYTTLVLGQVSMRGVVTCV